ncbi:MAG: DUF4826 family protein [Gammaproteobacteria bacterium]|jgi:hypothetical protein
MKFDTPEQEQAFQRWIKEQCDHVAKYLFKHQVISGKARVESAWVVPYQLMLGQAWASDNPGKKFWVITGDVSTDHIEGRLAKTPREAARYFALRWQLQGARLETADADGARPDGQINWTQVSEGMARKAERLYQMTEEDSYWQEDPAAG